MEAIKMSSVYPSFFIKIDFPSSDIFISLFFEPLSENEENMSILYEKQAITSLSLSRKIETYRIRKQNNTKSNQN